MHLFILLCMCLNILSIIHKYKKYAHMEETSLVLPAVILKGDAKWLEGKYCAIANVYNYKKGEITI